MLTAVNRRAVAEGLRPGMRLADARALYSRLVTAGADPVADRRGIERLALWCSRFTPRCAIDGDDGLLLGIAGCGHLFGGEAALVNEIASRLDGLGIESRLGLADTPAAAWALARFGAEDRRIATPGDARAALGSLPVEALRIAPGDARLLRRLGLITIGAVDSLPRTSLARRFARRERCGAVLSRLDQALGRRAEPVEPMMPPPVHLERLAMSEPLVHRDGLDAAAARLMAGLTASLERDGADLRQLVLWCYRADGGVVRRAVSTVRATRDGDHLLRLLAGKIETLDPGLGIDAVALHAARVEPLKPEQLSLTGDGREHGGDIGLLADHLTARLGGAAVRRLEPVERHLPEKAERAAAPGRKHAPWPETPDKPQRPFRLFDPPEPVEAMAEVPDGPPLLFTWRRVRRRIVRAAGPERIEPEWWTGDGGHTVRDYYRVEDAGGRRYWLYRAGLYGGCSDGGPQWYMHGLYG